MTKDLLLNKKLLKGGGEAQCQGPGFKLQYQEKENELPATGKLQCAPDSVTQHCPSAPCPEPWAGFLIRSSGAWSCWLSSAQLSQQRLSWT